MITQALSIAILDNEVLNLKYGDTLSSYHDVTQCLDKVLSNRPDSAQNEPEPDSTEDPDEGGSIDACFILVDYMTAILIRLITQSGSGDYWHNNLVGVLAKLTVKIKVLLLGLKNSATTSVVGARAVLEEFGHLAGREDEDEEGEDRGETP